MNNIDQYIFDLEHVLAHLRDTLEYVLPREHNIKVYEQRNAVLHKGIEKDTPLGKFLDNNSEAFKDTIEKYNNMLADLYSPESKVIMKNGETVRVDHSQHLVIYDYVTSLMEPIKDILYFHVNRAKQSKELEPIIENLLKVDDTYYRLFVNLLLIQDFEKSFFEFQKVMSESQGKPTPQSNYIVQNELAVMAKMIRNIRSKNRFTDNKTLDLLDDVIKLVEMTEGRRDRIDNKPFTDLFKEVTSKLSEAFNEVNPLWVKAFNENLKDFLETLKNNTTTEEA